MYCINTFSHRLLAHDDRHPIIGCHLGWLSWYIWCTLESRKSQTHTSILFFLSFFFWTVQIFEINRKFYHSQSTGHFCFSEINQDGVGSRFLWRNCKRPILQTPQAGCHIYAGCKSRWQFCLSVMDAILIVSKSHEQEGRKYFKVNYPPFFFHPCSNMFRANWKNKINPSECPSCFK